MMKKLLWSWLWCFSTLVLFIVYFGIFCNGEGEESLILAPMEKGEQEALFTAIQGFVGKWWNGSDLYPDPCGWTPIQGVNCDLFEGFWYVTELNIGPIHDNSLSCAPNAEITPHLFALNHLKSLSFFNCFISPLHTVSIPSKNWQLLANTLESLEFRSNSGLIGQIPPILGQLWKLQSLVLIENGLTGSLLPDLGKLLNLRRLVLSGNMFEGKIPESFGGLSKLLIMDMSRNSLSSSLPLTFGGLTSLLKLDLSNNKLEGGIPKGVENLKNLTLLDLSNNKFSKGFIESFQKISSLEELVLSNNPTGGDLMSIDWYSLKGLVILDLANMSLTGGIPEAICDIKSLRFLRLNHNKLIGNISPKIAALPNICSIYLNGNNLTGELKFSQEFYGKMGRRFGAWDNPNLCYPNGLVDTAHGPYGVKQCQQQVMLYEINFEEKSTLGHVTSFGFSRYGHYGVWYILMVIMVVLHVAF